MVDIDLDSGCTLNKKIRNAQLAQYNFILGKKGDSAKKTCQPLGKLEMLRLRLKRTAAISSSFQSWSQTVCLFRWCNKETLWFEKEYLKGLSKNLPFTSYFFIWWIFIKLAGLSDLVNTAVLVIAKWWVGVFCFVF